MLTSFQVLSSTEQQLRCLSSRLCLCSYKYILIFFIINVQQGDSFIFFKTVVRRIATNKSLP